MTSLIPNIFKTGISRVLGSNEEKSTSNAPAQPPPKDLNELVDRVMENQNIDNKTKREILSVILNNLQVQTNEPALQQQQMGMRTTIQQPQYQPQYYPQPQPVFIQAPQPMFQPQFGMMPQQYYQQAPPMYYQPPQIQAPQSSFQLDYLTSRVNDLSQEMGELVNILKSQAMGVDKRADNMNRIQSLISTLSASNNTSSTGSVPPAAANNTTKASNVSKPLNTSNMTSESSDAESSTAVSSEEEPTVTNMPERAKSAIGSMTDTVTSALNGMSSLLSPSTDTEGSDIPEQTKSSLTAANQQVLQEAQSEKSTTGDNMVDVNQYQPEQKSLNQSINENAVKEGLRVSSSIKNESGVPSPSGASPISNLSSLSSFSSNVNTPAPTTAAGNVPAQTTAPAPTTAAGNVPAQTTTAGNVGTSTTAPAPTTAGNVGTSTIAPTPTTAGNVGTSTTAPAPTTAGNVGAPAPAPAGNVGAPAPAPAGNVGALAPAPAPMDLGMATTATNTTPVTANTKQADNLSGAIEKLNQQPTAQTGGGKTLKKRKGILSSVAEALGVSDTTQKKKRAPKQKKTKTK